MQRFDPDLSQLARSLGNEDRDKEKKERVDRFKMEHQLATQQSEMSKRRRDETVNFAG